MKIDADGPDPVGAGPWLVWHHDGMFPPPGSEIARSAAGNQAYVVGRHVGVQFHPEATRRRSPPGRWATRRQSAGSA